MQRQMCVCILQADHGPTRPQVTTVVGKLRFHEPVTLQTDIEDPHQAVPVGVFLFKEGPAADWIVGRLC